MCLAAVAHPQFFWIFGIFCDTICPRRANRYVGTPGRTEPFLEGRQLMHFRTSAVRANQARANSTVCPGKRPAEAPDREPPLQPSPDRHDRPLGTFSDGGAPLLQFGDGHRPPLPRLGDGGPPFPPFDNGGHRYSRRVTGIGSREVWLDTVVPGANSRLQ